MRIKEINGVWVKVDVFGVEVPATDKDVSVHKTEVFREGIIRRGIVLPPLLPSKPARPLTPRTREYGAGLRVLFIGGVFESIVHDGFDRGESKDVTEQRIMTVASNIIPVISKHPFDKAMFWIQKFSISKLHETKSYDWYTDKIGQWEGKNPWLPVKKYEKKPTDWHGD